MNAARFSSTLITGATCLTLLLGISAHSLTPANADPPVEPAPNKEFAGTWRGKINGADLVWITDGRVWSTYIEGTLAPFCARTFEAANGRFWKTRTARPARWTEGPFHFIDADTISMTGRAGGQKCIWKGRKRSSQAIATPMKATPPSGQTTPAFGQTMPAATGNKPASGRRLRPANCRAGHAEKISWRRKQARGRRRLEFCGGTLSCRLVGRLWRLLYGQHIAVRSLFFTPAGGARAGGQASRRGLDRANGDTLQIAIASKLPRGTGRRSRNSPSTR